MIFSRRPARRLALVAAALAAVGAIAAPASAATSTRLHVDVENGESGATGSTVRDDSGYGANGVVQAAFGGGVRVVEGLSGSHGLRFPARCSAEPCPNAMVRIPDQAALDPGTASFEWGAAVKLTLSETAQGANVIQKGLYNQSGGQWKLQVDGSPGLPSCILSGTRSDGSFQRTKVRSSVTVADGVWHRVVCRRTSSSISIIIDGVTRGSMSASVVRLSSSAPVTIGAKSVESRDNDQFHGVVDEIFMRLI